MKLALNQQSRLSQHQDDEYGTNKKVIPNQLKHQKNARGNRAPQLVHTTIEKQEQDLENSHQDPYTEQDPYTQQDPYSNEMKYKRVKTGEDSEDEDAYQLGKGDPFTMDDVADVQNRRVSNGGMPDDKHSTLFKDQSYMNVMADDSASQMNRQQQLQSNMRNNPFMSNLENAKMLAQLTRERVNGLNLREDQTNQDSLSSNGQISGKQFQEFQKVNKYLSGALRHLNVTIDVLLEQYNPIKFKYKEARREGGNEDLPKEKQDAQLIQRKMEEIILHFYQECREAIENR